MLNNNSDTLEGQARKKEKYRVQTEFLIKIVRTGVLFIY